MSARVVYVVSDELAKVSSLLPSNRNRSLLVHLLVNKLGLLSPSGACPIRPQLASLTQLLLYHEKDYLDFILDPKNSNTNVLPQIQHVDYGIEDDCPPFQGLPEYVQMVAGASLTAAAYLRSGKSDVAICWDGGRHHAQKAHAAGFCYVADCVLAVLALKKPVPAPVPAAPAIRPRVMYLDLDLHFSDAVSQAFYHSSGATPQLLTLSIHHASPGFFPVSPLSSLPDPAHDDFDPFTLSLPLHRGAASPTFARIWPNVERVRDAFKPDFVVVQCGVDGLAGDPCATWNWSIGTNPGDMGWCVRRIIEHWGAKVLLLGGGGYNSPNAARAWAHLTAVSIRRDLALDTPIPDHAAFPLYAPSFTVDVEAGNMRDENSEEYLTEVDACFSVVIDRIQDRMGSSSN